MDLPVSTGSSVERGEPSRVTHQLTSLDVHLVDENAGMPGSEDKRCTIEAHVAGHRSVAVSHNATSLEAAYAGATRKLSNLLNGELGRPDGHKGNQPPEGPASS